MRTIVKENLGLFGIVVVLSLGFTKEGAEPGDFQ
jgi:hypothetical protein